MSLGSELAAGSLVETTQETVRLDQIPRIDPRRPLDIPTEPTIERPLSSRWAWLPTLCVGAALISVTLLVSTSILAFVDPVVDGQPLSPWRALARCSGMLALVLLGAGVISGLVQRCWPSAPTMLRKAAGTHVYAAVLSVVSTVVHMVALLASPSLGIGWLQILVPWTRQSGPLAQACAVLAVYLMIAMLVTSALRRVLSPRWFYRIHQVALPLFGLACLHSVLAMNAGGTSVRPGPCSAVGVLMAALLLLRFYRDPNARPVAPAQRSHLDQIPVAAYRTGRVLDTDAGPQNSAPPAPCAPVSLDHLTSLLITQTTWEADGVISLVLTAAPGERLPSWEPGAHIQVVLPSGRARLYSLFGDPLDREHYRIAVFCNEEGRGASWEIHHELRVGARLQVGPPRNGFTLEPAPSYLFIAGGIGITPILPMVRIVIGKGLRWRLIYLGRSKATMAFADAVAALHPYRATLIPEDKLGRPNLTELIASQEPGTAVYSCGPGGLIEALREATAQRPDLALRTEAFSGVESPHVAKPLNLKLCRSGVSLQVAQDQTILEAVRDLVPSMAGGCEQGICGRCTVRVIDGVPEHADIYLTQAQRRQGKMLICVSGAKTDHLTLDL